MGSHTKLCIATRGSTLALWQAHFVKELLTKSTIFSEVMTFKTTGDKIQDRFLHEIGGKGLFVKELEQALLDRAADIAVHSLKDMPVRLATPFVLAAVLKRHSPADALIVAPEKAKDLKALSESPSDLRALGIKSIATGSLRRRYLLKRFLPGVKVCAIRGNIDSRIKRLLTGEFDALLLAESGLNRLEIDHISYTKLCPSWFIPCAGQGALAIETRADDAELTATLVNSLQCSETRYAVDIERSILAALGGDCTMPFGCYTRRTSPEKWKTDTVVLGFSGNHASASYSFANLTPEAEITSNIMAQLKLAGVAEILDEIKTNKVPHEDLKC